MKYLSFPFLLLQKLSSLLLALTVALSVMPFAGTLSTAHAASLVPVSYDSFNKIINIGADYDPNDPAQAPFVNWPSNPQAPKNSITFKEVQDALVAQSLNNLITNQGTVYTLNANIVIKQNARLDIRTPEVTELRLNSSPKSSALEDAFVSIQAIGGHLLVEGPSGADCTLAGNSCIKVFSWNGSGPDTNLFDGRSYLLALTGGRMDIHNAEMSYLGYQTGGQSGLAWRETATKGDPANADIIKTGPTGEILDSNIHNNYYGQYSFEAFGLKVLRNSFHDNVKYGFDPHDFSTRFEVANNVSYNNGSHGIIFSRGCTYNLVHDNVIYDNQSLGQPVHGIVLDRGSDHNQVYNNTIYGNTFGIGLFQSSNNYVHDNTIYNNATGIVAKATYIDEQGRDPTDRYDGLSTDNNIVGNNIHDNSDQGIYLFERADHNTIDNNKITNNGQVGVYIKTGYNTITYNTITNNGNGVIITGDEPYTVPPTPVQPYAGNGRTPGAANILVGNEITNNDGIGIRLQQATKTVISSDNQKPNTGNIISENGSHGIALTSASEKNDIIGNIIHGNGAAGNGDGVSSKDNGTAKNLISQNSITDNTRSGIRNGDGTANGIQPPTITSASTAPTVTGTAPGAKIVEVYQDPIGQGQYYLGTANVDSSGNWSFALPQNFAPNLGGITAIAIDASNNTSAFGGLASGGAAANYQIVPGSYGETTISVKAAGADGAMVTLPDIERSVKTISPTATLLQDQGNGVWLLNASIKLNRGVTLTLTPETVTWLKLTSQDAPVKVQGVDSCKKGSCAYDTFVKLYTYNGVILIDGVKITSWDPTQNTYDTNLTNGRSYILAKYDARMDIKNADLSYLGSADGESYGVSWRDINDSEQPDMLLTRVTGDVENSNFSNNYYGIYTFQASNMKFTGNKFHNNIGYGFDPHDFSNHFTVENNESFENGNHGFIISRGCNNFVFRNNKSYNNHYTIGDEDRSAHGFMLDPGSPNSRYAQVPSHDNLLENNEAYGNDGYGLRVVGSISNTIQLNNFHDNQQGITLEQASTGNTIAKNTITNSALYGIYLFGGSDNTTITGNTITKSGKHGIYMKTGNNTVVKNTVTDNGSVIDNVPTGSGIATYQESDYGAAAADFILPGTQRSLVTNRASLLNSLAQSTEVTKNTIAQNTVQRNADEGIELKSATNTTVEANTVTDNGSNGIYLASGAGTNMVKKNIMSGNGGYGIRANGTDVFGNTWTQNIIFENKTGGIVNTSSANNGIKAPQLTRDGNVVTGTTLPGATVELFSDDMGQGRYYETRVTAGSDGTFRAARAWKGSIVNATVTDLDGNSSGFTVNMGFGAGNTQLYLPMVGR